MSQPGARRSGGRPCGEPPGGRGWGPEGDPCCASAAEKKMMSSASATGTQQIYSQGSPFPAGHSGKAFRCVPVCVCGGGQRGRPGPRRAPCVRGLPAGLVCRERTARPAMLGSPPRGSLGCRQRVGLARPGSRPPGPCRSPREPPAPLEAEPGSRAHGGDRSVDCRPPGGGTKCRRGSGGEARSRGETAETAGPGCRAGVGTPGWAGLGSVHAQARPLQRARCSPWPVSRTPEPRRRPKEQGSRSPRD